MIVLVNSILETLGYQLLKIGEDSYAEWECKKELDEARGILSEDKNVKRVLRKSKIEADYTDEKVSLTVKKLKHQGEKITISNISKLGGLSKDIAKKYIAKVNTEKILYAISGLRNQGRELCSFEISKLTGISRRVIVKVMAGYVNPDYLICEWQR